MSVPEQTESSVSPPPFELRYQRAHVGVPVAVGLAVYDGLCYPAGQQDG